MATHIWLGIYNKRKGMFMAVYDIYTAPDFFGV